MATALTAHRERLVRARPHVSASWCVCRAGRMQTRVGGSRGAVGVERLERARAPRARHCSTTPRPRLLHDGRARVPGPFHLPLPPAGAGGGRLRARAEAAERAADAHARAARAAASPGAAAPSPCAASCAAAPAAAAAEPALGHGAHPMAWRTGGPLRLRVGGEAAKAGRRKAGEGGGRGGRGGRGGFGDTVRHGRLTTPSAASWSGRKYGSGAIADGDAWSSQRCPAAPDSVR